MSDWTQKDGRSNSSDLFESVTQSVAEALNGSLFDLCNGRSGRERVAGLIVANLAHGKHRLVPQEASNGQ